MRVLTTTALVLAAMAAPVFAGQELETIDVAVIDAASGERVYVRGFDDGFVEHKFYTPQDGYSDWVEVPDPAFECIEEDDLESVEAFAFTDGSILYVRGFESGLVQQNVYTPWDGWTGWVELAHPDDENGKPEPPNLEEEEDLGDLDSIDVELMGNDIFAPRIFVRGFEDGYYEQCVYTPTDGFSGWSEIPGMPDLFAVADNIDDELESIQVTPMGGLHDPRIFVAGFRSSGRLYQNIYTPGEGFTGWKRVRGQTAAASSNSQISSVDVQYLGDGVILYVRGRTNGNVQQNFFTPEDGFLGWRRVTRRDNPEERDLESCSVEMFAPGLNGARIYVRALEAVDVVAGTAELQTQQCFYDPETGTTRWEDIP